MSFRKMSWTLFVLLIGLLLVNNVLLYRDLRESLGAELERSAEAISKQVRINVEQTQQTYVHLDEMMAEYLRAASVAIEYALPNEHSAIRQQQLEALKKELGVSDITLWERTEDDVVGVRSTKTSEVGLSSKNWGDFYDAFQDLFEGRPADVAQGQALDRFWAGAISPSSTDLSEPKNKYGYFYDASNDYMINPFVDSAYITDLEQVTGTDAVIEKTLIENPSILEVTLYNPASFSLPEDDPRLFHERNGGLVPKFDMRKILFGKYKYASERDAANIEEAVRTGSFVSHFARIGDKEVLKTYYPVVSENTLWPYVVGITTDLKHMNAALQAELRTLATRMALYTAAALLALYLAIRVFERTSNEIATTVQSAYADEITSMFLSIRGQRHDLNNHLSTIHALIEMDDIENLRKYASELVDEAASTNDLIQIGHPAVAALLRSKCIAAFSQRIAFTHEFPGLEGELDITGMKSVDFVRMIGNLIDNAFEEVMLLPPEERRVHIAGSIELGHLKVKVTNALSEGKLSVPPERYFAAAFTTKPDHQGIGLSVVQEKAQKYKGRIEVRLVDPRDIEFQISLPLTG